jgi:hypothetical protein
MSDWPSSDYWMYDQNGQFIHKYVFDMSDHPDFEFLEDTARESDWEKKTGWSVDEACALSFGLSPTKVPYDEYMKEMYGSSEFATYFCDLSDEIIAAQDLGILSTPDISPRLYVEWARNKSLPLQPSLAQEVISFHDAAMNLQPVHKKPIQVSPVLENGPNVISAKPTVTGPALRRENTLRGILYALAWKHYRFTEISTNAVAEKIEGVVDELRNVMPGVKIEGNIKTIGTYLREAIRDLGRPEKQD